MFKSLLLAVVLMVSMIGVASATAIPHNLVGGVIVTKVTGAATMTAAIDYNVQMPSLAHCELAITKIEQAFFSARANVTQGLPSENDAQKLVFLQCVQRAGILPVVQ